MTSSSLPMAESPQETRKSDYREKKFNSVWLAPTYKCNNDCKYCYVEKDNKSKDMSFERATESIDLIREMEIRRITFIGAESTLYPKIEEIIRYVKKGGMKSGMVTNGRRFSDLGFARRMKEGSLESVGITVLGTEETNDEITQIKGSYKQTIKGVENCLNEGLHVTLNTTISEEARGCMDHVLDLADRLGVKRVSLNVCTDLKGDHNFSIRPSVAGEIAREFIERNRYRKDNISLTTSIPVCNFDDKGHDYIDEGIIKGSCCVFRGSSFALDFNGDVLPCPHFSGFPYFNIFENGSRMDGEEFKKLFFNGEMATQFRDKIWTFPSNNCIDCSDYGECTGGCPIYWQTYSPNQEIKGGKK